MNDYKFNKWFYLLLGFFVGAIAILIFWTFTGKAGASFDDSWSSCSQISCGSSEGTQTKQTFKYECPKDSKEIEGVCLKLITHQPFITHVDKVKTIQVQTRTCEVEEPTQCIEPTPTGEPGAGNVPDNPHTDTTEAPGAATCNIPFDAPVINSVKITNGIITWSWLESDKGIDKYSILYGKDPNNLIYGVDNISKDALSFDVSGLDTSTPSYAQVWSWKSGCAEKSNTYDP